MDLIGMSEKSYRTDIDGLRAVAVVAVIVFHYAEPVLPMGYLGVDIFFVISGYLISRILWDDLKTGSFSLLRFYERRIRRLMPALLLVLAVTCAVSWFILLPGDFSGLAKSTIAALFFVPNIYFWRDTDYFSTAAELKPLLNLWSLGVEEQFYLLFPFVLWLFARRPKFALPSLAGLVLLSLISNIVLVAAGGASPAFFLSPTRAWELGLGAIVALAHQNGPVTVSNVRPLLATLLRGLSLVTLLLGLVIPLTGNSALPLPFVVVSATAFLIWLGNPPQSITGRLLGLTALTFVGKISYSLYLWHWPVIVLAKYVLVRELTGAETGAAAVVSFCLASLGWALVEQPFRKGGMSFKAVGLVTGSVSVLLAACSAVIVVQSGFPSRLSADAATINAAVGTNFRCPVSRMQSFGASRACDLTLDGGSVKSATVVLLGNSHAQMYAPLVAEIYHDRNQLSVLVPINGCLPTPKVNISAACSRAAATNLSAVLSLPSLSTVIVAFNWPVDVPLFDDEGRPISGDAERALVAGVSDLVDTLAGRKVVLIGPIKTPGFDIASEMSRQIAFGHAEVAPDHAGADVFRDRYSEVFARFVADPDVIFIRPDQVQCPDDKCYFVLNGTMLFADSNHLAKPALALFRAQFDRALP